MKLDEFLTSEKITEADFAEKIASSQPHVNRMRRGKSFPSPEMIRKIRSATQDKVSLDDWYADLQAAE